MPNKSFPAAAEGLTHPLAKATTFQLALIVDTLLAERHLLQLNASLASHMVGAGGAVQTWLEARRDEVDATVVELARLALYRADAASQDDQDDLVHIRDAASSILCEVRDVPVIDDVIKAHRAARALDPDSDEAAAALGAAEDALFHYRPVTAYEHEARANYLLGAEALDLSCWDTEDLRAFLRSMVR